MPKRESGESVLQILKVENGWVVHVGSEEGIQIFVFVDREKMLEFVEDWTDHASTKKTKQH